jgi:phospholipid/cholesterol/gamma-HCH transport system substrate-binding protein
MYDYIKQLKWAKLKIGLVVTVAVLILLYAVMFAGNIEKLFSPKVNIHAEFVDIKGLREGSPVWFSGVEVGTVKSIKLTSRQKIMVAMSISSDVIKYFKSDSIANILTLGLLGDKYIEISSGSTKASALKPGGTIKGSTQIEIQDIVETSQNSIAKIADFVNMLEEIVQKIDKSEGTVSRFIKDPSVYENLQEATAELSKMVKKLEGGEGSIARLVNDDTLYLNILSSVEDIKIFAETLKTSEGTINKLINDPALYDRFLKASESLDSFILRLESSGGTINRLIEDESLYKNVNAASERLNSLLERIDRGEGLMGSLVKDEELSDEINMTVKELNLLIKDIKENPGRYFKFSIF